MQRSTHADALVATGSSASQERSEEWSLDTTGRLVVGIREHRAGDKPTESTHIYQRQ
jgi:hypothetical protein